MKDVKDVAEIVESSEIDLEFVGAVEDVTFGWSGYTYDVSWGDRHPW